MGAAALLPNTEQLIAHSEEVNIKFFSNLLCYIITKVFSYENLSYKFSPFKHYEAFEMK